MHLRQGAIVAASLLVAATRHHPRSKFSQGFRWWNMGYAAAIAFVLFAIILVLTLLALRLRRFDVTPVGAP